MQPKWGVNVQRLLNHNSFWGRDPYLAVFSQLLHIDLLYTHLLNILSISGAVLRINHLNFLLGTFLRTFELIIRWLHQRQFNFYNFLLSLLIWNGNIFVSKLRRYWGVILLSNLDVHQLLKIKTRCYVFVQFWIWQTLFQNTVEVI